MTGVRQDDAGQAWAAARAAFDRGHVARVPGFFGDDVLAAFDRRLPDSAFRDRIEDGVCLERWLADEWLLALVTVLLNDPALFRAIDALTGCGPIGCFSGRVYERRGADQYYPWHSDCVQDRLVALSVNLSGRPYAGGVLQVRRAGATGVLAEIAHARRGDAALVRIDPSLEHRVTPVTSEAPRLVLAGWFRRRPQFREQLGA